MPRYSIFVSVPEVIYGTSYFSVEVEAENKEEAEKLAVELLREGEDGHFLGFVGDDSESHWEAVIVEETHPWKFEPGQKVIFRPEDPYYPDIEVEVIQMQNNFGNACKCCHLGREHSSYDPNSEERYLIKYPTGVIAPVRASLLHALSEDEQRTAVRCPR